MLMLMKPGSFLDQSKTEDDDTPEALFKTKLGLPRLDEEYCRDQALAAIWDLVSLVLSMMTR